MVGDVGQSLYGYFKYNQRVINLSMGPFSDQPPLSRRTSERRRLKLLRNIDEYRINNPYRAARPDFPLPDDLSRQLRKVDYLSSSSISLLVLQTPPPPHSHHLLSRMHEAARTQEERFVRLFGHFPTTGRGEAGEAEGSWEEGKREGGLEEVVQTKEEPSINVYDPVDPVREGQFVCGVLRGLLEGVESESGVRGEEAPRENHTEPILLEEQFQHYFAS